MAAAMERVGQVLVETYRVERLVAEGGMAAVYEARHLRVPKRFAVKFLRHQLANHAEALARFRREAEIIATLEHPNIVQLVDYNVTDDGLPYIVLEFLDGEDLLSRMDREGRLQLVDALKIARQVAAALEAAHARDVTHRDLKPANIFVTRDGTVKVLDFGVAKLRRAPELTAMNVVVGTVGYMSPEQISGQEVDPRTDQWALASIIYAMLAGQPAFEIDGPVVAQATRILNHDPPPIPGITEAVNLALSRGMAKRPLERYATVGEMVDALIAAAGATVSQRMSQEFDVAPSTDPTSDLPAERTTVTNVAGASDPDALPAERTTISAAPPTDPKRRAPAPAEDPPTDPIALVGQSRPSAVARPAVTGEIHSRPRIARPSSSEPPAPEKTSARSSEARPPSRSDRTTLPPAAERTEDPAATLPPLAERTAHGSNGKHPAVPVAERVTLKPQMAPPELEALRDRARAQGQTNDATSKQLVPSFPRSTRMAWILFGAAAGGGVATIVYLLAR
jgi:serine/threonine-protein kinase